jgi:hypothetical protein
MSECGANSEFVGHVRSVSYVVATYKVSISASSQLGDHSVCSSFTVGFAVF